jgi:5'-3' exonuclease
MGIRVHLIDGTYELFRAWFAAPSARDRDGREVGAVRVLARQLLRHLRDEAITHVGVAFDHVVESFRNDLFDGYKTGEGLDPDLYGQFGPAEELTRALGLSVWPMVEFEADDALATAAVRFGAREDVEQVRILSPDKDLAQVVAGTRIVTVWKDRLMDEAAVVERYGIAPASIPDWLALVGDDADGIPGIKGFGARTASMLLGAYERIDAIPDSHEDWTVTPRGAARLAATLAAERESARLYRTLATLRTDVPLKESLEDLRWRGARRSQLGELCDVLGDTRLLERVPAFA